MTRLLMHHRLEFLLAFLALTVLILTVTWSQPRVAKAVSCPQNYHEECTTDPCGSKEQVEHCVRSNADGSCAQTTVETVCRPTSRCSCEHD
jgi:hypothetical protein